MSCDVTLKKKIVFTAITVAILIHVTMMSQNCLKVVAWNANGINSKWNYLDALRNNHDITFVMEHKMFECELFKLRDDCKFKVHAYASKTLPSYKFGNYFGHGGVAVYYKQNESMKIVPSMCNDRMITIEYDNGGCITYIIGVYLPQQRCQIASFSEYLGELEAVIEQCQIKGDVIVIGDTNCHFGDEVGIRTWGTTTGQAKKLLKMIKDKNLEIVDISHIASGPNYTYMKENIGKSYIDHIMISRSMVDKVIKCHVGEECMLNTSDHQEVSIHIKCLIAKENSFQNKIFKSRVAWNKLSPDQIYIQYTLPLQDELYTIWQILEHPICHYLNSKEETEELLKAVVGAIQEISRKNLPYTKYSKNVKPYWRYNKEALNGSHREKKNQYKKWCEVGRPRGDSIVYREYKRAKKVFRQNQKQAQYEYEASMIDEIENEDNIDNNFLWYLFRKARNINDTKNVNSIRDDKGDILTDPNEIVQEWSKYFHQLFEEPEANTDDILFENEVKDVVEKCKRDRTKQCDTDIFTTEGEVREMIKALKLNKACGYDEITGEHLKYGGNMLVKVITRLFNRCLELKIFPKIFKYGLLVVIPKPGKQDYLDKNNYRGITLLTTIGKLYEKLIKQKIEQDSRIRNCPITSSNQGAGKEKILSLHTNFLLRETISYANERNQSVHIACLDIEKAFDKVWQQGLLYKLHKKQINTTIWHIIEEFCQNFQLAINLGNFRSDWFSVKRGVHQGGPLSSLLFLLYFDDLLIMLQESKFAMTMYGINVTCPTYADDIAIVSNSRKGLQEMVNIAYNYSRRWKFRFNAKKCVTLSFGKNKDITEVSMGSESINEVDCISYLGTPLYTKKCKEKEEIQERIQNSYRRAWLIKAIGTSRLQINPYTFSKAYWAAVVTKLMYGLFLLDLTNNNLDEIDRFHINVARNIQGLNSNAPAVFALAGLKWQRLKTYMEKDLLKFIGSILNLDYGSIYKQVLLYRLLDKRNTYTNSLIQRFKKCCGKYEMKWYEAISENSVNFSMREWNKSVNINSKRVENNEWTATVLMYKSLQDFRKMDIDVESGFKWWMIGKWMPQWLYKIKVVFKFIVTNNEKCGYNCGCIEKQDMAHIIFKCNKTKDNGKRYWDRVIEKMPNGLANDVNVMTDEEKVIFIYSCLNGVIEKEWYDLYESLIQYVYNMIKTWYESL